jgi:hypothetical protein
MLPKSIAASDSCKDDGRGVGLRLLLMREGRGRSGGKLQVGRGAVRKARWRLHHHRNPTSNGHLGSPE